MVVFSTAAIAILQIAAWMGTATEEIAVVVGPTLGGLLNATFGNATELIIALVALNAGLIEVVKASVTGSIIGNLLLVMGLSMFLGGLRYKEQEFQPVVARVSASLMNLAVIAMLLPTAMNYTSPGILFRHDAKSFSYRGDRANWGLCTNAIVLYENPRLSLRCGRGRRGHKNYGRIQSCP